MGKLHCRRSIRNGFVIQPRTTSTAALLGRVRNRRASRASKDLEAWEDLSVDSSTSSPSQTLRRPDEGEWEDSPDALGTVANSRLLRQPGADTTTSMATKRVQHGVNVIRAIHEFQPRDEYISSDVGAGTTPPPSVGLFDLALELRERIYELAMEDMPLEIALCGDIAADAPFPAVFPSFAFANSQVYREVRPVLIRGRRFALGAFRGIIRLSRFVLRPPKDLFVCIRQLELVKIMGSRSLYSGSSSNSRPPVHVYELLLRCTALQELTVEVTAWAIMMNCMPKSPDALIRRLPEAEMLEALHPELWFTSENLKILRLKCMGGFLCSPDKYGLSVYPSPYQSEEDVFRVLVGWLLRVLQDKIPKIDFQVHYTNDTRDLDKIPMGYIRH
ncbi:hypothetical protein BDV95DRAFT_610240 [Massariosphaeria phaeospora]|uniref:Uncharacterized protein n=1 Tax=Massariosphaeria phaeospora TaxID=100035 RepID=A0A7C8M4I5_9PLEO|nr:hypothetical protein BDV95DRAFT_610240 [Massariosphaeria phaeospora]